jgi:primosomal protein N' (replication factor Y)
MYADIVVFTNGDPKNSTFTYSVPTEFQENATVGMYVTVPYGKKNAEGIIKRLHNEKPSFATKDFTSIVFESAVLPDYLIKTADWMSKFYHESIKNCFETVTFFRKKVRLKKRNEMDQTLPEHTVVLMDDQRNAFEKISKSFGKQTTFVLHGITGSGKTEVYLAVIEELIKQGKQVIYLVPEIALTPQTIMRVEKRFPNRTSVLHSQVSEGERYQAFLDCLSGEKQIMIGSRSSLFAPFPNLGAIVIDEEHDNSYKQDSSPHYNAVTTAEYICQTLSIPLILGSATPRINDYFKTTDDPSNTTKNWELLTLSTRALNASLPKVKIVDMREELKKRNFSTLSDELQDELIRTIDLEEQAILFLNKRGVASSLMCRMCGWTAECPRCAVSLTVHNDMYGVLKDMLLCHHCDYHMRKPQRCPNCTSPYIKELGSGTEKIEQDIKALIPTARIVRMDRDTTVRKGSHQEIYSTFLNHEADILIGTQMITKGWDIPNVTLVGIVNADTALHLPQYASSERAFALITQVSGRAGRADKPGKVVLQSYNPDHYAVVNAAKHAYNDFYNFELGFRKQLKYPPFSQLALLVTSDLNQEKAEYRAEVLYKKLAAEAAVIGNNLVEVLGVSTGIIPKLRNKWYYQIVLKGEKTAIDQLLDLVNVADWKINVDPEGSA